MTGTDLVRWCVILEEVQSVSAADLPMVWLRCGGRLKTSADNNVFGMGRLCCRLCTRHCCTSIRALHIRVRINGYWFLPRVVHRTPCCKRRNCKEVWSPAQNFGCARLMQTDSHASCGRLPDSKSVTGHKGCIRVIPVCRVSCESSRNVAINLRLKELFQA